MVRSRKGPAMNDYMITTDNNADLPENFYKNHEVGCTYLSYTLEGKEYTEGNFLPVEEFYNKMRAGSMPTTSQVNPESARALFEPYLKDGRDILHIAFSSGLSGTFNSCRIAAEELMQEYPGRRDLVLDSLSASLGKVLLVYLAQERKERGGSIEDVANWVETHKRNIVHLFTVDDLNHLYRGGRVSRTTAFLGGMLNIKPILHVDDAGKLIPIGIVRGRKKSLLELADLMDRKIGSYAKSCNMIFISHGDCREEAEFLARKIKQKYQITTELINDVGAVIGAHSGPGTMALFFVGDVR